MFSTFEGYGIDSVRLINIQKFEFCDTYEYFNLSLNNYKNVTDEAKLKMLKDFMIALDSATSKGFVTEYDLSKFPIFAEIIPLFTDGNKDDIYIRGSCSQESYKWLYNMLILNMYLFSLD